MGSFFSPSTPKVKTEAPKELEADSSKAKLARKSLFATEGGQVGEELDPTQVGRRGSLFGN